MMLWALLTTSMLAEISKGGLVFVIFFLVVWGVIAISSIKAAKKSQLNRMAPPPLPGQGNVRRVLPKIGPMGVRQTAGLPRRPIPGVAMALPPLSTITKTAAMQRAAMNARGVRSGKPGVKPPSLPTASQSGQVASAASRIASPARTAVSTPTQVRPRVASWINAQTLRSQFLLAEALRPPVALRKDPFTSR